MRITFLSLLMLWDAGAYASINFSRTSGESIDIGLGLRSEIISGSNSELTGDDDKKDAFVAGIDARIYSSAKLTDALKVTLNTGYAQGDIKLLDAITRFEPSAAFNIWAGRFLPPSDRSNLSGPYYLNAWTFPGVVQRYPAIFAGRDNGLAFWGDTVNQKLKYQIGLFEGMGRDPISNNQGAFAAPNDSASPLVAARLSWDFFEPEPGYYTSSTWYGSKKVLAVGVVYQQQRDAVGTGDGEDASGTVLPGKKGDFDAYSVDAIFELPLAQNSAWTLEGAYYSYDSEDLDNLRQGNGYFALTSYLFSAMDSLGGRYQPVVRYQSYDNDLDDSTVDRTDLQVNYIIKGHDARLSLVAAKEEFEVNGSKEDLQTLTFGTQLQF